jgi:hypothetical protein
MEDLYLGIAIIALTALLAGGAGYFLCAGAKNRTTFLVLLGAMGLTGCYVWLLQGRLLLARVLPVSNLIVVSNLLPITVGFFAGVVLSQKKNHIARRVVLAISLIGLAGFAAWKPIHADPPKSHNRWSSDGVCLQSNSISCSPCAAATLLRHHGIATDEREMCRLCLTNSKGTTALGLYRGLKLKTRDTDYEVTVVTTDVDTLLKNDDWPAVLLVKLETGADVDPRYANEWGWTPGVGHAVVVFGRVGEDRIEVGDPSVGREQWMIRDLRTLWQGEGLRLTKTR